MVGVEVPFMLLRVSLMRETCVLCPVSVIINGAGIVPNLLTRLCGCYKVDSPESCIFKVQYYRTNAYVTSR